jgi:hypothetical protein
MDSILKEGILTPKEVLKRIVEGRLSREVLGVSYGVDSSNFPEHVSLLSNINLTFFVAQAISHSRSGRYEDDNFMAIGYVINEETRALPGFVDKEKTREMNQNCYSSECLFHGRIDPKYISKHIFAARTFHF